MALRAPIRACAFWQDVGSQMQARGFAFDVADFGTEFALGGPRPIQILRRGSFRNNTLDAIRDAAFMALPGERRHMRALVARNVAFVESVLAVTGKRVFVDTSKDRLRLGALRRLSGQDVRAIHLVRDVRGVVASRLRRGTPVDAREAARQWARMHQRLHVSLKALPEDRRLTIAQETLDIYAPIANRLGMSKVKNELEELCFRYLEAKGYESLRGRVEARRRFSEGLIDELKQRIEAKLKR